MRSVAFQPRVSEHEKFQNMKYKRWPSERLYKEDFFEVAHQHRVSEHIKKIKNPIFFKIFTKLKRWPLS